MPSKLCTNNYSEALRLVKRFNGFPLILIFADSFLTLTGTSAAQYLRLYKKSWNDINKEINILNNYINKIIQTIWMVLYDKLKRKNEGAVKLL